MKRAVAVESASAFIDEKIKELNERRDWRGKTLAKVREIIQKADPEIVEEWKWVKPTSPGTAVWSHGGIVCTGETYKNVVKMTFAKGAALKDPSGLFNSSLDGKVRRAIDIHEGDKIDEAALKDLIRSAVAHNLAAQNLAAQNLAAHNQAAHNQAARNLAAHNLVALNLNLKAKSQPKPKTKPRPASNKPAAKADGEAAALAKIAAMPAPYRAMGERLHTLILRSAPTLQPTVWYGMPGYTKDGKTVCFFRADKKYMTFGFTQEANLTREEGAPHQLIESAWYFTELDDATEVKLSAIVRRVAS